MKQATDPGVTSGPEYQAALVKTRMCAMQRRLRRFSSRGGLAATLLLMAVTVAAAPYVNPHLLIETDELARLLGDPGLRIVDLRRDVSQGAAAYAAGHIPGAVLLAVGELDDPKANAEGFPILPEKAAELFGRLGIDHETPVVAYDDVGGLLAARLFFVLEYYGHTRSRVLNGGLVKWQAEGRPLTSEAANITPKRFEPHARRALIATAEEIEAVLGKEEISLIDARSPAEFKGEDVRAERGGHIPGAANVDWTTTLNPDRTFKSADALRELFAAAGVRPDRQTITYCQSGVRASHDYLALRLLGFTKLKNYDGSWNEWGNALALPVEK